MTILFFLRHANRVAPKELNMYSPGLKTRGKDPTNTDAFWRDFWHRMVALPGEWK